MIDLEVKTSAWNGLLGPAPAEQTPCTPGVKRPSTFLEDLHDLLDGEPLFDMWWAPSTKTLNRESDASSSPKKSQRASRQVSFEDEDDVLPVSQRSLGRQLTQAPSIEKSNSSTQTQCPGEEVAQQRSYTVIDAADVIIEPDFAPPPPPPAPSASSTFSRCIEL